MVRTLKEITDDLHRLTTLRDDAEKLAARYSVELRGVREELHERAKRLQAEQAVVGLREKEQEGPCPER